MDFSSLLNDKQLRAVSSDAQYNRIIAGAGSGKTRVLTYRIAYLIGTLDVSPEAILAITFTNKVAKEMHERARQLIPEISHRLKIMTYHSFAARFLRQEIHHLGYPRSFTILDDDDQEKLIKTIAQEKGYRRGDDIVKQSYRYITGQKSKGIAPGDIRIERERFANEKLCLEFYVAYEEKLKRMFNLDFDDLLIKSIFILEQFSEVRSKWQKKFLHILIDEFQDTNDVQYRLLKLLLTDSTSLYVVGDPDQTIYSWRGANQSIILDLHHTYPIETIILDQNYRSTQTILNLANTLISHNRYRVKKDLFSTNKEGEPITHVRLTNHEEEARWVVSDISRLIRQSVPLNQIVILYRANYLTLPFEKELNRYKIPFKIFGGMRFYQRKEIKDVLAYFKLLINDADDISFERIINVPRRGIGDVTIELIKKEAFDKKLSMLQFIKQIDLSTTMIKSKTIEQLVTMVQVIDAFHHKLNDNLEIFSEVLKQYLDKLGYFASFKDDEEEERMENIQTLFSDMESFIKDSPTALFDDYIENIALTSSQDEIDADDYVSLMTVHTAKGLEFDYVYLIGLNEGVFPSIRTLEDDAFMGLEEERRLCYVAFTRARLKLSLTCSSDYSFVISSNLIPSRFFKDAGLVFARPTGQNTNNRLGSITQQTPTVTIQQEKRPVQFWTVGDKINHESFGFGEVLSVIDQSIIEVKFETMGIKKLVANHPKISKVTQ
jgi:DNA helicase II / ATP-dependent DNA helicase PcrA